MTQLVSPQTHCFIRLLLALVDISSCKRFPLTVFPSQQRGLPPSRCEHGPQTHPTGQVVFISFLFDRAVVSREVTTPGASSCPSVCLSYHEFIGKSGKQKELLWQGQETAPGILLREK